MKKLNKRFRAEKQLCTVEAYDSVYCGQQERCTQGCHDAGTDNYGMTFIRAEYANKYKY